MHGYTNYLAAFGGFRTRPDPIQRPDVKSPVGAQNSTSVQDQRESRAGASREPTPVFPGWNSMLPQSSVPEPAFDSLDPRIQTGLQNTYDEAYAGDGYRALSRIPGWFDMPEWQRNQIMRGTSR
jgi:hypothetical protein